MANQTSSDCSNRPRAIFRVFVLFLMVLFPTLLSVPLLDTYIEYCHTEFDDTPAGLEQCISGPSSAKSVLISLPFCGLFALIIINRHDLFCR